MAAPAFDEWSRSTAPEALNRHAPGAAADLEALIALHPTSVGPRNLTALARRACARTLALAPLPGRDDARPSTDGVDRCAVRFAEQFSMDVSMIGEEARVELSSLLGDGIGPFLTTVYVADWAPRLRHALDRLFRASPTGWPAAEPTEFDGDPWPLVDRFMRSVARLRSLDPVTTEVVRLREARQHNCRICKSLRSRSALSAGADESSFDAVDRYETSALPARHKAALAFTDAFVWQPAHLGDDVVDGVRRHFSPAESVELTLDIMRNASSKIAVATGTDAARVAEGLDVYDINDDGSFSFESAAPAT